MDIKFKFNNDIPKYETQLGFNKKLEENIFLDKKYEKYRFLSYIYIDDTLYIYNRNIYRYNRLQNSHDYVYIKYIKSNRNFFYLNNQIYLPVTKYYLSNENTLDLYSYFYILYLRKNDIINNKTYIFIQTGNKSDDITNVLKNIKYHHNTTYNKNNKYDVIIILLDTNTHIKKLLNIKFKHFVYNEYVRFIHLNLNIVNYLDSLNENGSLCIKINNLLYKISIQSFYLISKCFNKIDLYELFNNIKHIRRQRIIIFTGFNKKNYYNLRDTFLNIKSLILKTYDLQNTEFHIPKKSWVTKIYKQFDLKVTNEKQTFITSIFDKEVPDDFIKPFRKFQKKINRQNIKFLIKMKLFLKEYLSTDNKLSVLNKYKKIQIETAKNFCFQNDIPIRDIYKDSNYIKLLQNTSRKDYIKTFFKPKSNIDLNKLHISLEGMYSISHWKDNEKILNYLNNLKYNYKNATLIDATANVGGISLYMSLYFKKVVAVELNYLNYKMLKHNIKIYKSQNIEALLGESTNLIPKIINDYKKTIVLIDPPWGGLDYKENKVIDLYLGDMNVYEFIDYIIDSVEMVILKAPFNYNLLHFKEIIKYKIDILTLKKYQIIFVFNEISI